MKTARMLIVFGALMLALMQAGAQQASPQAVPAGDTEKSAAGTESADAVEVGLPIQQPNPLIPKEVRKKNVSAVLHGTIAIDGTFKDLTVVSGDPALTGAALDAVLQWRYSACKRKGTPIELPTYITLNSNHGKVNTWVEPELPFPTKPDEEVKKKISAQEYAIGKGGTKAPKLVYGPDPAYSEAARAAKYQGTLLLGVIVGSNGSPQDVWVARKLGLGLDQKAIETVRQWKFEPATRDGKPVAVILNVEVAFHLY
jgi:TonB family protein